MDKVTGSPAGIQSGAGCLVGDAPARSIYIKGTMHTISPGRNRVNFQILAYLLTTDLLYGTGCLSS